MGDPLKDRALLLGGASAPMSWPKGPIWPDFPALVLCPHCNHFGCCSKREVFQLEGSGGIDLHGFINVRIQLFPGVGKIACGYADGISVVASDKARSTLHFGTGYIGLLFALSWF